MVFYYIRRNLGNVKVIFSPVHWLKKSDYSSLIFTRYVKRNIVIYIKKLLHNFFVLGNTFPPLILYRENIWNFIYIFSISQIRSCLISLTHSSHKFFCILKSQIVEKYGKHKHHRDTCLLLLSSRCLLCLLPVFSVDYFFWSWHCSTAQWFPLRHDR